MKKTLLTGMLLIISSLTFPQSITNISPVVHNDKIYIYYTLSGLKYYQYVSDLNVFVRRDGGSFVGPLKQIVDRNLKGLKNGRHLIVWDALKEMPFTSSVMVFDIRIKVSKKDRRRKFFTAFVGNDVTPIGLRMGQLGKTAWYIEARGSFLAKQNSNYLYKGGHIIDYDKPGYYEFGGTKGWQAYSAIIGITQQVAWNTFLYCGAGYGVENFIMKINEFDYNENVLKGTDWVMDDDYKNSGIEVDVGLILRLKHFIISGGGNMLNYNSFGWTASMGFCF